MAQFKPYNYDELIMVPVNLEDQLLPGSFEFTVHTIVEHHIDMSVFDANYHNDETGCRAYDPKILLKVILCGYARGLDTSRRLEHACRQNINFMALACAQAPDHSTIAAFVSTMNDQIKSIFQDILLYCDKHGLLGGTSFSIDGCKLPSNASKEKSGTFDQLKDKKQRLENRLAELIAAHQQNDASEKKINSVQKRIEKLDDFLAANEPKIGSKGKEIKSNVTDNDSNLMQTSHGVTQGYNAQALVDSKNQIILQPDAGNSGQDDEHVATMLDGAKKNLKAIGKDDDYLKNTDLLCDTNYFSATNIQKIKDEHINGYIPDTDFRKRDPRLITGDAKFTIADFDFDVGRDVYTCPTGSVLTRQADSTRNGKKHYRHYAAQQQECSACSCRHRCLAKKTSTRRWLSVYHDESLASYTRDLVAKMDSDEGRAVYDHRLGMVEPVFANIRFQKRLNRFWRRGKDKVNIEWTLYCLVHNIEKCIQYCVNPTMSPAY